MYHYLFMPSNPEFPQSGEPKNREVFDIFDRASSHRRNTSFKYFIGDGIVVRVGWVDNDKESPDLTLELRDEKYSKGVGLTVDPDNARYVRETRPALAWDEWMKADREARREARKYDRRETFLIPTAALEPVARAVSNHEPHRVSEPPESETLYESSLKVEPLSTTDIDFIRELIDAFDKPLD